MYSTPSVSASCSQRFVFVPVLLFQLQPLTSHVILYFLGHPFPPIDRYRERERTDGNLLTWGTLPDGRDALLFASSREKCQASVLGCVSGAVRVAALADLDLAEASPKPPTNPSARGMLRHANWGLLRDRIERRAVLVAAATSGFVAASCMLAALLIRADRRHSWRGAE